MTEPNTLYIASQNSSIFDELQRMLIAYENNQATALEGSPGVGKNCAIDALAQITGKKVYRIRCTEETMARDIIGSEKLAVEKSENGSLATKTVYQPGPLMKGMQEGTFVVLDEANQLTPTVQKSLNSALEENRTIGDLDGNLEVKAEKGYGLFITYNPETGVARDDLEIAVKDRCKILYFDEQPTELKVRMALLKTGFFDLEEILDDTISVRGIYQKDGKFNFAEKKHGKWFQYKRNTPLEDEEIRPYLFYDRTKENSLQIKDAKKDEYYQIAKAIVKSLEDIKDLRRNGTIGIAKKLDLRLDKIGRLNVNAPSARLTIKLIQDYMLLRNRKYHSGEILGDIAKSIIEYTVPASEKNLSVGNNTTVQKLIEQICMAHGIMNDSMLIEIKKKTIDQTKNTLVNELMTKGFSQKMAANLVDEANN